MSFLPQHYKIVSGIGKSQYPLVAFDNALCSAGIGDYNLVKVSSILPANCIYAENIPVEKGSILYAAYSTLTLKKNEIGMTAAAVAIPSIKNESGVIFECSSINSKDNQEEIVKKMCIEAMNNRNKSIQEIKSTSQEVRGEQDLFVSAISAVVMW
jgi:arginine decarboxylase